MRQALVNKVHNFNEIMGVGRHCSLLGPGRRIRVFFLLVSGHSGCFLTGVGSLRDVFLYTLYIISTILSFEHICTSIFFC